MPRYIEMTDELLKSVIDACSPNTRIALRVKGVLENAPTADVVEVKHGEWITVDDGVNIGDGTHMECSRCGAWNIRRDKTSYCPNCGAKMDAERGGHGERV